MSKRFYPGLEKIDQVTRIPEVADLLTRALDAVEKKQRPRVPRNLKPNTKLSADSNHLTPSGIDSLKQNMRSVSKQILERNPSAQFVKPGNEEEPLPANSSPQEESKK